MRLVSRGRVKLAVLAICTMALLSGAARPGAASAERSSARKAAQGKVLDPSEPIISLEEEGLRIVWEQRVPQGEVGQGLRAVYPVGRSVLLETTRANLIMIDAKAGTWEGGVSFRSVLSQPPELGDQFMHVVSGRTAYALSPRNAQIQNEVPFRYSDLSRLLYCDDSLLVGTGDGKVFRVNLEDGTSMWRRSAGGTITRRPEVKDKVVYAAGHRGRVIAVDVESGALQWSWEPPDPAYVTSAFALGESVMYATDSMGFIHALDLEIGMPLWKYPIGGAVRSIVVLPGSRLLVSTYERETVCVDLSGTEPKACWDYPHASTLVGRGKNNTLYLATRDGLLAGVSLDDGRERWRIKLADGVQIVGDKDDKRCYAFNDPGSVLAIEGVD